MPMVNTFVLFISFVVSASLDSSAKLEMNTFS